VAQTTTGLRRVLNRPQAHRLYQIAVGARRLWRGLVEQCLQPQAGLRLLDLGCGTADVLEYLPPQVEYVGVDMSPEYVAAAQKRFHGRGRFEVSRIQDLDVRAWPPFDCVLAAGVLHHLDDWEALALFRTAYAALVPGGRLVSMDPCLAADQSRLARFLVLQDRGRNVRTEEQYVRLARCVFADVMARVEHGRVRIPFTHITMLARK